MWLGFSAAALSFVGHERARGSSKSRDVSYETHAIHAFAFTIARGRSLDTSPEDVLRGKDGNYTDGGTNEGMQFVGCGNLVSPPENLLVLLVILN